MDEKLNNPLLVMVIEDSEDLRQLMRTWLELEGHQVIEAADGKQAVEMALRERPDVVLMDLNIPVIDGVNAARLIRESEGLRGSIPIIAVTAYLTSDIRTYALAAGCNDVIGKPVNYPRLKDILKAFKPRHRSSR